jgi:dTDP-4-amino-4,6-dideoxygalactose transaminase
VGAVPIIAEVDESLMIDPADVEKKITRRTKAIMPVHMSGLPADMDALVKIARKHKLKIIEDACQAVGGSYKGKRLTTIGDVGAFSFNQFKVIACGEGGAVVTSQRSVFEKALIHHDGGCFSRGHVLETPIFCGWSYRVSEIQGAIMRVQLRRLDRILANLRARKQAVYEALAGSHKYKMSLINCPKGDCGCTTAIKFESEARMRAAEKALKEAGITACGSPIDSGIHVYSRWSPILEKRASSHPGRDAYKLTEEKYQYSETMCPQSTAILSSTLTLFTEYALSVAGHRRRASQARKIIESL